jgi:hypothetical protein
VENPFRSEGAAFNFVLLAIGFFAAIVIATALLGSWAGLAVFVALVVAGTWRVISSRRR